MKKLSIFSFSRSDYASLKPFILKLQKDPYINLDIIAGGSHLLERFGYSVEFFKKDGIEIHHKIPFLKESDDTFADFAKASKDLFNQTVDYLTQSNPDYVFILGDRWEMLPVAMASSFLQIPILHHSGGDLTLGSQDNITRYAISTQAHIHFVAVEEHKKRLSLLGEEVWRIETVGEPALTSMNSVEARRDVVLKDLGLNSDDHFVLATFHPTSFDTESFEDQIDLFLLALDRISKKIVLTAPNPDPGSKAFYEKLLKYSRKNSKVCFFENLGSSRYYGAMKYCDFMIGNSSSGIWESASFQIPVINLGRRQEGRFREANVLDSDLNLPHIEAALQKVESKDFRNSISKIANSYYQDNTCEKMIQKIKNLPSREILLAKKFIDPCKGS